MKRKPSLIPRRRRRDLALEAIVGVLAIIPIGLLAYAILLEWSTMP